MDIPIFNGGPPDILPIPPFDGPAVAPLSPAAQSVLLASRAVVIILASLSILGSLTIILTFVSFRAMRRHPVSMIFYMTLCDFIYTGVIIILESFEQLNYTEPISFFVLWLIYRYFAAASMTWFGMISLNLVITTVAPFTDTTSLRKLYHLFGWLFPLAIVATTVAYALTSQISLDRSHVERYEWETEVPVILFFLLALVTLIIALAKMQTLTTAYKHTRHILTRIILFVLAFAIIWIGPTTLGFYLAIVPVETMNNDTFFGLYLWGTISYSVVGLVNALVWASYPAIFNRCTRWLRRNRDDDAAPELRRRLVIMTEAEAEAEEAEETAGTLETAADAVEDQEDDRVFAKLNKILRKNVLTCVLLGMQHSIYKLHRDVGLPLEEDSEADLSEFITRSMDKSKRAKMTHVVSNPSSPLPKKSAAASASNGAALDDITEEPEVVIDIVEENKSSKVQIAASFRRPDGQHISGIFPPVLDKEGLIPLKYEDFRTLSRYTLNPILHRGSDEDIFVSRFDLVELAPKAFMNIRKILQIDDKAFYDMLSPVEFLSKVASRQKLSDGRSGSLFCFSPDRRFIIKTIAEHEFKTLVTILPYYYAHLTRYKKTLLMKILGAFSVTVMRSTLHVIAMTNVFEFSGMPKPIHEIYDLKGSWVDRGGGAKPKKDGVRKDADLSYKFDIGTMRRSELIGQLKADAKLLHGMNIMDYSLLVGVHDLSQMKLEEAVEDLPPSLKAEAKAPAFPTDRLDLIPSIDGTLVLCLGVIDILQAYNQAKKFERFVKIFMQCKDREGISSIPPPEYALRFVGNVERIFE